jgi:hypothetical protein
MNVIKNHALTACRTERLTRRNLASRRGKTRVKSVSMPRGLILLLRRW